MKVDSITIYFCLTRFVSEVVYLLAITHADGKDVGALFYCFKFDSVTILCNWGVDNIIIVSG